MVGPHDLNRDVVPSLSLLSGVHVCIVGSESEIWRGSLRLRELLHHIELLHATLFVELVEQLPLAESFLERLQLTELADCVGVEGIHTLECLLPDGLLVVCEQETPKFTSLEEVFTVVILL